LIGGASLTSQPEKTRITNQSTIWFGSLNARGMRAKTKRRACIRQLKAHCDIALIQETHADESIMKEIQKEFPGDWFASHCSNPSAGVAIFIPSTTFGIKMVENSLYTDDSGRLIGLGFTKNTHKFYVIGAYAPCVIASIASRKTNATFLNKLQALMLEKRAEGYNLHAAGDMNFIRSTSLDAAGGNPTVYKEQADWIKNLENGCDFHDKQRFLAPHAYLKTYFHGFKIGIKIRLDYFLVSHRALEQTTGVLAIPLSGSDHRLLVLTRVMGAKKIQGRGLWKHNNALLKEDEYCKLMEDTFIEAKRTRCSDDPAQTWDWIKQRAKEESVNLCKKQRKDKREDRACLEHDYTKELKKPKPDITEHRAKLQKHFQEEDDVIRFRANLEETEHDERITLFFFKKIMSNRQEINVTCIKTSEYPNGTETREETMDALESHYKEMFTEKQD
jgi:exonuclease III